MVNISRGNDQLSLYSGAMEWHGNLVEWMASTTPELPQKYTAANAVTVIMNPSEIIDVSGVRMDQYNLGAPTAVDKEGIPLITIVRDGDTPPKDTPWAMPHIVNGYKEFMLIFPQYRNLSEEEVEQRGFLPHVSWIYDNKRARWIEMAYQGRREFTQEECTILDKHAKENSNSALLEAMGSWYFGYFDEEHKIFCAVWNCTLFGISGDGSTDNLVPFISFFRNRGGMDSCWMGVSGAAMPIRGVPILESKA